ncbi:MAG: hypothetical protein K2N01_03995 [Lachnospiraceae bacterium]|nr:hypothetical protein [Lachnospiraceae bacterium]
MKKSLFLILSVSITLFAGCGNKNNSVTDTETETTEAARDTEEADIAENTKIPGTEQTEKEETEEEQTEKQEQSHKKDPGEANAEASSQNPSASQAGQKEETKPQESKPGQAKPQEQPEEQTVTAVSYNPASVCSQAIAKCQAGGMITTTDNLANLLAEGKITQEEYDSYYPYDGLGYYSVFVETDLNKASTTSGRKLGSEDGIADYIAGMMLLETEPVFYIEYAGVYTLNGADFYEFRCYR